MTHYMGELGMMVPFPEVARVRPLSMTVERRVSQVRTITGRRLVHVGPTSKRQWSVEVPTSTPEAMEPILGFIDGEFGYGPWWWVNEHAQKVNVLPAWLSSIPRVWRNTTRGGPVRLPDGSVAGQSLIATGSTYVDEVAGTEIRFPVVPGVPITGSAWLGGANHATRVEVRDANDNVLDFAHVFRTGSGLQRTAATVTPGELAHHAVLRFINPGRIVHPALTWTPEVRPYGAGDGCPTAVLEGSVDQQTEVLLGAACGYDARRPRAMDSGSYTVIEVN